MEVKNPITFPEQVKKLQKKGFIITDEKMCENFFMGVNYYRFSAYLLPYKLGNKYQSGITFNKVYKTYEFDRKLRAALFKTIEQIELLLRAEISYYFSHKYGALGYLDINNFKNKKIL